MNSRLYTNTSNIKGIAGLIILTVVTTYAASHADGIVEGTLSLGKNVIEKAQELGHRGMKKVAVVERMYNGNLRDTGKRIWVKS